MVDDIQSRKGLQLIYDLLEVMKDEISPIMPVQQLMSFILVALNEGKSLKDLVHIAGIKNATMSRHLIDLGKRNRKMEEGFMLVDCQQDPMELRKNQYTVSRKGQAVIKKLLKTVQAHGDLR